MKRKICGITSYIFVLIARTQAEKAKEGWTVVYDGDDDDVDDDGNDGDDDGDDGDDDGDDDDDSGKDEGRVERGEVGGKHMKGDTPPTPRATIILL